MSPNERVPRKDFEAVVSVLGNPIRRNIIKKLSEGPDYTLRLSNELNIHQQLAAKHLKVIQDAKLVNITRQKSNLGADKNIYQINKFYSLQIDFSPSLYNERLISFNDPRRWIQDDDYMERLEDEVNDIEERRTNISDVSHLRKIIEIVDEELEWTEKRRARLMYIRNLALGASFTALEEMDRRRKQILQRLVDIGTATIESLSNALSFRESEVRDAVNELEKDGLVSKEGDIINLIS